MPQISILIPLYNVQNYIERCLDSIKNQTFDDYEIIMVDDGCTDSTMEVVDNWTKINRDIKTTVLKHTQNSGLMLARRTAYTNASGRYFVFVDSDDFLPNDALQILYSAIENSNLDLVAGAFNLVNDQETTIKQSGATGIFDARDYVEFLLSGKLTHSLCGRIFRRDLFSSENSLPAFIGQTNSEDMMLSYSLVPYIKNFGIISNPVYNYYYNPNSSSKVRYSLRQFKQLVRASNYVVSILHTNLPEELQKLLERKISSRITALLMQDCPREALQDIDKEIIEYFSLSRLISNLGCTNGFIAYSLWKCPILRKFTQFRYRFK